MQSKAATVPEYIESLPPDRRETVSTLRQWIKSNIDPAYEERMQYGMIGYCVPHSLYPAGYHCDPKQPLPFLNLASQKNYLSLYISCLYDEQREEVDFRTAWAATGRKLNMGKCCIRFQKLEDLALDVLASTLKSLPVQRHIAMYEKCRADAAGTSAERSASKKAAASAKEAAAKKAPARKSAASKAAASKPAAKKAQ